MNCTLKDKDAVLWKAPEAKSKYRIQDRLLSQKSRCALVAIGLIIPSLCWSDGPVLILHIFSCICLTLGAGLWRHFATPLTTSVTCKPNDAQVEFGPTGDLQAATTMLDNDKRSGLPGDEIHTESDSAALEPTCCGAICKEASEIVSANSPFPPDRYTGDAYDVVHPAADLIAPCSLQGDAWPVDIGSSGHKEFTPEEAVTAGGTRDDIQPASPLAPRGKTWRTDMHSSDDEKCTLEAVAGAGVCDGVQPAAVFSPQGKTKWAEMDSSDDEELLPEAVASGDAHDVIQHASSTTASGSPQGKNRWADMDSSDDEGFTPTAAQKHERKALEDGKGRFHLLSNTLEATEAEVDRDRSPPKKGPAPEAHSFPQADRSPNARSPTTREVVPLPAGGANTLIGRNGETARRLQDKTGARIFVDRENHYARVMGSPEAVTAAIAQIHDLLSQAPGDNTNVHGGVDPSTEDGLTKESLTLPLGFASTLIGPGGHTVNRLQEQTGARIWVEKTTNRARVMGTPDQVTTALGLIQELLAQTGGKKAPCKWFAQGRCQRGAACGFAHPSSTLDCS
jgi:hypothetical protein